jgi:hypothetical protein
MPVRIVRAFFIRKILDARFSLSALQEWKSNDPEWWSSDRNEKGRRSYTEAMRERERLEAATESELIAELTDIGALGPPPHLGDAGRTPA